MNKFLLDYPMNFSIWIEIRSEYLNLRWLLDQRRNNTGEKIERRGNCNLFFMGQIASEREKDVCVCMRERERERERERDQTISLCFQKRIWATKNASEKNEFGRNREKYFHLVSKKNLSSFSLARLIYKSISVFFRWVSIKAKTVIQC